MNRAQEALRCCWSRGYSEKLFESICSNGEHTFLAFFSIKPTIIPIEEYLLDAISFNESQSSVRLSLYNGFEEAIIASAKGITFVRCIYEPDWVLFV